jgi:hypothetical protein
MQSASEKTFPGRNAKVKLKNFLEEILVTKLFKIKKKPFERMVSSCFKNDID